MFCRKCGNELKEGSVFCSFCGAKVDEEKTVVIREQVVVEEENYKVGLGCAITSFIMMILALSFGSIPFLGVGGYVIFMFLSFCFAVPGFIVSLTKIIMKKRLGAAITAMCFTLTSVSFNIFFLSVINKVVEEIV